MSEDKMFAAAPKVVKPKKKYREPVEEQEQEQETKFTYNNLMWNRRVERGNTYAAIATSKNVEIPHKNTFKPRPNYSKPEVMLKSTQKTNQSFNQGGTVRRGNIDIFTDEFVETLTDKPPRYEKDTQTEFKIQKPIVRLYMPVPDGIDTETQIWDNDLFDFDYEVEPLLRVLCGKTLEISRAQVLQQEELRVMKERQNELHQLDKTQQQSIKAMEDKQLRIKEENDQKIAALRQKKEIQRNSHKKLVSRVIAKQFTKFLGPNALSAVQGYGFFRDTVQTKFTEHLLPWMYRETEKLLAQDPVIQRGAWDIIEQAQNDLKKAHRLAIEAEHTRRQLIFEQRRERQRQKKQRKLMYAEQTYMRKYLEDYRIAAEKEEERRLAAEREEQGAEAKQS